MNYSDCILFFILILLFLQYSNISIESFVPNEKQFAVCTDNSTSGATYYQSFKNRITKPLTGFFSATLDLTKERNLNNHFKPPKCYGSHETNFNYFNTNKIIDISENTWKPLKDPHYKYYHPFDNYAVTYSDDHIDQFLEKKQLNIDTDNRLS
jgi:hypothetical protein